MRIMNGILVFGLAISTALLLAGCKEKTMKERKGMVTMKGNPVTLVGNEIKVGDKAPDCNLTANDLSAVSISSFKGKVRIVASVPSLDTAVCDMETRRFNEEAGKLDPNIVILTISMDLPFAQKRWCGAAGIQNVKTLSDYRDAKFGTSYGVLIKEFRLLARTIFVIDKTGTVRYIQIVNEVAKEPDYQAAIDAAKKML